MRGSAAPRLLAALWPAGRRAMHRTAVGAAAGDAEGAAGPKVAARVAAVWDETPTVKGVRLKVDPSQFEFRAGQWVDFFVPGIREVGGFSIVTTPAELAEGGTFDLGVKATKHPVAQWVCSQAAAGSPVHVRAGGTFTLDPLSLAPGRPSLFVAGGIGVTPLASMIAELLQHWEREDGGSDDGSTGGGGAQGPPLAAPQAVLLYSARSVNEFALLPRLLDLQHASGRALQLRLHCSDFAAPPGGDPAAAAAAAAAEEAAAAAAPAPILLPAGVRSLLRRRLTAGDLQGAVHDLRAASAAAAGGGEGQPVVAYVCGPPALSDQVVSQLQSEVDGVEEVVMERWW